MNFKEQLHELYSEHKMKEELDKQKRQQEAPANAIDYANQIYLQIKKQLEICAANGKIKKGKFGTKFVTTSIIVHKFDNIPIQIFKIKKDLFGHTCREYTKEAITFLHHLGYKCNNEGIKFQVQTEGYDYNEDHLFELHASIKI